MTIACFLNRCTVTVKTSHWSNTCHSAHHRSSCQSTTTDMHSYKSTEGYNFDFCDVIRNISINITLPFPNAAHYTLASPLVRHNQHNSISTTFCKILSWSSKSPFSAATLTKSGNLDSASFLKFFNSSMWVCNSTTSYTSRINETKENNLSRYKSSAVHHFRYSSSRTEQLICCPLKGNPFSTCNKLRFCFFLQMYNSYITNSHCWITRLFIKVL